MSKKFIIGAIIALVLILGGGVGYYYYNQASADAYTKDFCNGITGQTWRNCVQNMASWKAYMQRVDNTRFKAMVNTADKNRKGTVATTTTTAVSAKPITTTPTEGYPLPANHDADAAKIYTTANYTGTPVVFGLGSYTKDQIIAKGIDPSAIQSLTIAGGYTLTAYTAFDLTGADKIVWDRSTVNNLSWKEIIGSFKIEKRGDTSVFVYTKGGYDGMGAGLKVGKYTSADLAVLGIGPKTISSVAISVDPVTGNAVTDYTVKLYATPDLTGTSKDITATTPNMASTAIDFNDQAMSVEVIKK